MKVQVKLLCESATMPTCAHASDAGLDLHCAERVTISPGQRQQIKTGIAIAIPVGYVGLIWDKSGLSQKVGLKTLGGEVDAGYRGEVLIGILNSGDSEHVFEVGDKVAQMLIQTVVQPELAEADILDETERGEGAFGSTGK